MTMALGNGVVVVEQRTSSAALSAIFISDHDRRDPLLASVTGLNQMSRLTIGADFSIRPSSTIRPA